MSYRIVAGFLRPSGATLSKRGRKGFAGARFIPIPSTDEPVTPPVRCATRWWPVAYRILCVCVLARTCVQPRADAASGWQQWQSRRTGLLGRKVGMTAVFDEWGQRRGLTAIQVRARAAGAGRG